jgi:DNA invertase Pin-like site-specific DNA recombinase
MSLTVQDGGAASPEGPAATGLIRAAQYLRMSDAQQHYSIECQAEINADYAAENGYVIVRSYCDQAKSGLTIKGRDGLKELLHDVLGSPDYAVILVTDVSRWGRFQDPDEGAHYEFICRQAGVPVHYCAEVFSNDGGQASTILKSVKRVMAAEYSRQLSARTRAGARRSKIAGGCGGGPAPYGFAKALYDPWTGRTRTLRQGEGKNRPGQQLRFVPGSPEEIAVVRRIYRAYARDGEPPHEIYRALNREGVPFKNGGEWTGARIIAVLKNELAVGIFCFGKSHMQLGQRSSMLPRSEWSRVRVFKPIVAPGLFAKAARRLETRAKRSFTDDQLIDDLRRLKTVHGTVTHEIVSTRGLVPASVYKTRFGSLGSAFRLAGQSASLRTGVRWRKGNLTWENVEPLLTRLFREKGYLSMAVVNACPYLPETRTLKSYFGPLSSLFAAIGDTATTNEKRSLSWSQRARRSPCADDPDRLDPYTTRPSVQPAPIFHRTGVPGDLSWQTTPQPQHDAARLKMKDFR